LAALDITLETLTPEHLDGAVELSQNAGWPHRREDWAFVESFSHGIVAIGEGRVLATAIMTPYGEDAATINMVIVDEGLRGRGLGRQLMTSAIAKAGSRTIYLVATKDGIALYQNLGFVATGEIVQHQGNAAAVDVPAHVSWSEKGDQARIVALDREAFGHDRSAAIRSLFECAKFSVVRDQIAVQAFAAIRAFGRGLVIGPVVARSDEEAQALIAFLLAQHRGLLVRIDTDRSSNLAQWLDGQGLVHVGGGTSMRLGPIARHGQRAQHRTYALVSQALG
jgi:ribosomal protein S18 acetylase RimI-like enzyme